MELKGSHVVVTGASRGIGAALAKEFASAGAIVSVVARSRAQLESLAMAIGGSAFQADLLDDDQVDALVPRIEAEAGPIDVLVNNAGLDSTQWLAACDPQEVRNVLRLNLETPAVLSRAVLPGMLARGRGHLVYVSSLAGTTSVPGLSVYSASKSGLNHLTACVRLELRDTPLGCTLVAPGPVDTAMWDHLEVTDAMAPAIKRMRRLHLIPKTSPDRVARRTVKAVRNDKRHVRTPARLSLSFWLGESPRRISEMILAKVPTDGGLPSRQ